MEEQDLQNAQPNGFQTPVYNSMPPAPKKKSKFPVIIISAVIALILAAAAVIVFVDLFGLELFGKSDGEQSWNVSGKSDKDKEQSENVSGKSDEEQPGNVSESLPVKYFDKKKKLWGYINASGEYVIEPQFNNTQGFDENSDLAPVQIGEKWGYVNKNGEMVIKPQFGHAYNFSEGMARVISGRKWGYINTEGKVVINYQYDSACAFKNGTAVVSLIKNDGTDKYGLINKEGEYIVEPVYDSISDEDFYDGRTVDRVMVGVGEDYDERKYGFIDRKNGKLVTDIIYANVYSFSEGLAPVKDADGKWGYIDESGEYAISPQFGTAYPFKNGAAVVSVDDQYGYIDKKGQYIINPQFGFAYAFDENGFAKVIKIEDDNDKYGVINKNGDYVVRLQEQIIYAYKNGTYIICDDYTRECGLAGPDGNIIIKQEYSYISFTDDGFIYAYKKVDNNEIIETCYYDMNGNLIK